MSFLQFHVFFCFLVLAYLHEEILGRQEKRIFGKKLDQSPGGDRYEAIGRLEEGHKLEPWWLDNLDNEDPISARGDGDDFDIDDSDRSRRRHQFRRRKRSHRDRNWNSRRHKERRRKHRSESERDSSNSERDSAGYLKKPHHSRIYSKHFEDETGFHARHGHRKRSKKMLGTQVRWIPNIFAESSVKKPPKTCDCSKCTSSDSPVPLPDQGDQPETAAASSNEVSPGFTTGEQPVQVPAMLSFYPPSNLGSQQKIGAQLSMHKKRRRELEEAAKLRLLDADTIEFGSRDIDDEQQVAGSECPYCCKEKERGWAKPEDAVADLHEVEP